MGDSYLHREPGLLGLRTQSSFKGPPMLLITTISITNRSLGFEVFGEEAAQWAHVAYFVFQVAHATYHNIFKGSCQGHLQKLFLRSS